MKRTIALLFLVFALGAHAQEASPSPEVTATPQVVATPQVDTEEHPAHAELRLLRQHMEDAMNAQDVKSLLEGVTDDVVFSTMNGDVVKGKAGIQAYFDKMMKGPNPRVKAIKTHFEADELTHLYSPTGDPRDARFGVAYGHSNDEYTLADGTQIKVTPQWSAALIRDEQSWKIANFHYSVNMFDNPVLSALKGKFALVGGAGLLLGLLIGFFLGRRRN